MYLLSTKEVWQKLQRDHSGKGGVKKWGVLKYFNNFLITPDFEMIIEKI